MVCKLFPFNVFFSFGRFPTASPSPTKTHTHKHTKTYIQVYLFNSVAAMESREHAGFPLLFILFLRLGR